MKQLSKIELDDMVFQLRRSEHRKQEIKDAILLVALSLLAALASAAIMAVFELYVL